MRLAAPRYAVRKYGDLAPLPDLGRKRCDLPCVDFLLSGFVVVAGAEREGVGGAFGRAGDGGVTDAHGDDSVLAVLVWERRSEATDDLR